MKTLKDKVMEVFPVAPEDEAAFEPVMHAAYSGLQGTVYDFRNDDVKESKDKPPEVLKMTGVSVTYAFARADAVLPGVLRELVSDAQLEACKAYYEGLGKGRRKDLMRAVLSEVLEDVPFETDTLGAPVNSV